MGGVSADGALPGRGVRGGQAAEAEAGGGLGKSDRDGGHGGRRTAGKGGACGRARERGGGGGEARSKLLQTTAKAKLACHSFRAEGRKSSGGGRRGGGDHSSLRAIAAPCRVTPSPHSIAPCYRRAPSSCPIAPLHRSTPSLCSAAPSLRGFIPLHSITHSTALLHCPTAARFAVCASGPGFAVVAGGSAWLGCCRQRTVAEQKRWPPQSRGEGKGSSRPCRRARRRHLSQNRRIST